jgi:hypothetical protein
MAEVRYAVTTTSVVSVSSTFLFNLAWQEHKPLASLLDGEKS